VVGRIWGDFCKTGHALLQALWVAASKLGQMVRLMSATFGREVNYASHAGIRIMNDSGNNIEGNIR